MKKEIVTTNEPEQLYLSIRNVLIESRKRAYSAVNVEMLYAYWKIGYLIVEDEQKGNKTALYGKAIIEKLSEKLKSEFGKGYDVRNLRNMRKFYLVFQKWNAVRTELTWTHYRTLLKVQDESARNWYLEEAIKESWSSRQLDRQISTQYYERLLSSQEKDSVKEEANEMLSGMDAEDFIKDPYVLEFIDLKDYPALKESNLEQALIDNIQKFLLELGSGFCFVARQKLLRYQDEDFYVDLVERTLLLEKFSEAVCEIVLLSEFQDWLVNLLAKPYDSLSDELRSPLARAYEPWSHISCKHACRVFLNVERNVLVLLEKRCRTERANRIL